MTFSRTECCRCDNPLIGTVYFVKVIEWNERDSDYVPSIARACEECKLPGDLDLMEGITEIDFGRLQSPMVQLYNDAIFPGILEGWFGPGGISGQDVQLRRTFSSANDALQGAQSLLDVSDDVNVFRVPDGFRVEIGTGVRDEA